MSHDRGAPAIARPALWWAPERIYGVPDLIAQAAWLRERTPSLISDNEGLAGPGEAYVVLEIKFTTKLEESQKAKDLRAYAAQTRLYAYMLGQLQGSMPGQAYLVARDRVADPLPVAIASALDRPLDADLAALRDQFVEIKVNGPQPALAGCDCGQQPR